MRNKLASMAAMVGVAASLLIGGATAAQATTTVPDASCVNSDPLGLVNIVTCTINTTVQVPIDIPIDSVITFGDILSNNHVLSGNELDLLEVTLEDFLNNNTISDNLVFKNNLVDVVDDINVIDDIDVSKIFIDLL